MVSLETTLIMPHELKFTTGSSLCDSLPHYLGILLLDDVMKHSSVSQGSWASTRTPLSLFATSSVKKSGEDFRQEAYWSERDTLSWKYDRRNSTRSKPSSSPARSRALVVSGVSSTAITLPLTTPSHIVASRDPHAVAEAEGDSGPAPSYVDISLQLKLCPVVRVSEQRSSDGGTARSTHADSPTTFSITDLLSNEERSEDFVGVLLGDECAVSGVNVEIGGVEVGTGATVVVDAGFAM